MCMSALCCTMEAPYKRQSSLLSFSPTPKLQLKAGEPCDKGTILVTSTFLVCALGSYSMSYLWLGSSAVPMYAVRAMGRIQVGRHMALSAS